jgi:hypothetical protein
MVALEVCTWSAAQVWVWLSVVRPRGIEWQILVLQVPAVFHVDDSNTASTPLPLSQRGPKGSDSQAERRLSQVVLKVVE